MGIQIQMNDDRILVHCVADLTDPFSGSGTWTADEEKSKITFGQDEYSFTTRPTVTVGSTTTVSIHSDLTPRGIPIEPPKAQTNADLGEITVTITNTPTGHGPGMGPIPAPVTIKVRYNKSNVITRGPASG